jgi:type IV pilus assembly protein PilB
MSLTPDMVEGWNFQRGAGCRQCLNRGYLGRVGIYELLVANDSVRQAIMRGDSTQDLERVARAGGLRLLSEGAWELVKTGVTTIGEVARVVMFQEAS